VRKVGEILKKINLPCPSLYDEPMSLHTSFRIGGPADVYATPQDFKQLAASYKLLAARAVPIFVLGAGANILVSDRGIRGVVLDLKLITGCKVSPQEDHTLFTAAAGTQISEVSLLALEHGQCGLEFIYSMPGSVGGSVWMNARCYGHSVSEVLASVQYLDHDGDTVIMKVDKSSFGYKTSPFQKTNALITSASFSLRDGSREQMRQRMEEIKKDRESKGHFLYPCAGSIFKNNRAFAQPTGKLIDSLGLKGTKSGDAMVSDRHGNIIVNTGRATANDVLALIQLLEEKVHRAFGFDLEREILLVGDWQEERR
jgi:UDP-N-acetylmuramate dehydrogenase